MQGDGIQNVYQRVNSAKAAFVTRRANLQDARSLTTDCQPRPGDLVLARVTRIRQHTRIELRNGRRSHLFEGDELVLAYGTRYAADQFEAQVPPDLGPCNLVAAGGIAAEAVSKHGKMKGATEIQPLGLLTNAKGKILNLSDYALPVIQSDRRRPPTMVVLGTSMNSGKTTMAADLINGAARMGMKVCAAKITGTGSGPDVWKMIDAGAHEMLDFTDEGYASTFGLNLQQLLDITHNLIARMTAKETDLLVLEIADGLLQQETAALLSSQEFRDSVDGCLLASTDAIATVGAVHQLQAQSLNVFGIGGVMAQSPLTAREASIACGIPLLQRNDLHNSEVVSSLMTELASTTKTDTQGHENVIAFGS